MSPESQTGRPPAAPAPGTGRQGKREAIVEAARAVFLRNGYSDTSVDVIAEEAHVSKQTIYNHFGDKESLFLAVMDAAQRQTRAEGLSRVASELTETGDLERDLRAAARLWVELVLSPNVSALRRVILAEQVRHPELARRWTRPRADFEAELAARIEHHARAGTLDVPDAALAAHQLVLLTTHEAALQSGYGLRELSAAEIGQIVDEGVGMWLRCYRAGRPAPGSAAG